MRILRFGKRFSSPGVSNIIQFFLAGERRLPTKGAARKVTSFQANR
jgi:hypothetical protein